RSKRDWSSDVCSSDLDRAEVRELAVLDVAPNLLDGIQLWSVARQSFDRHPRPLLSEILPHHAARVPTESVPDHDDVATWEVALRSEERRVGKGWRGVW